MPKAGYRQSESHKRKRAKAIEGRKNPSWKGGRSRDYAYRVAGSKTNDGNLVHHVNGDPTDNRKENLRLLKGKKAGAKTSSEHEKVTDRGQGRPREDSRPRSVAYLRAYRRAFSRKGRSS